LQIIGKLDKEKLGRYKDKVITDKVVLTAERIRHINEHHPGDYEKYGCYIKLIIESPDYVIADNKNLDTVLFMKTIKEIDRKVQIVIRLNTNINETEKQNSILTFWKIKTRNYNQIVRNKEILWKD